MFGCALCRCECEGDEVCLVDQLPRLNNKTQLILCFTNFQFTPKLKSIAAILSKL